MARSLRGGVWGSIAQSLHSSLARRDIGDLQDKATDAATAFSSWDNCMEVNYCKYVGVSFLPQFNLRRGLRHHANQHCATDGPSLP